MIYGVGLLILALNVPQWWVRYVLWRHSKYIEDMPVNGSELARHLVSRFELTDVSVKKGKEDENYYSPTDKEIVLCPNVYEGKSITAVSVAAHEVGHAIQFIKNEPVSKLREKYLDKSFKIKRIGRIILLIIPFGINFIKLPVILFPVVGIITMIASVCMYFAILPEEYDASFNKALPILKEGYISTEHLPAAKSILEAAAYTYVASAFSDIVNLWRWFKFVK
ncbi:MAG: zinc metallopeptidase [Candidatus Electrothrix sp. AR3]|nr:zinc metallopeptidase [Candidatus Electrothrix sp. AR3]